MANEDIDFFIKEDDEFVEYRDEELHIIHAVSAKLTEAKAIQKRLSDLRNEENQKVRRACPHLPGLARTCPHLPAPARTCPHLPAPARTCPHLPAPARTCPDLQEKRRLARDEKKRKGQAAISSGMNELHAKYEELGKVIKKTKTEVKKQDTLFDQDDE